MIPADDTPWSDPGSTAGTPDRYQQRRVGGLLLSAGANGRQPDGSHVRRDNDVPWAVSEWRPTDDDRREGHHRVAAGVARSQAEAREAAERAARDHTSEEAP